MIAPRSTTDPAHPYDPMCERFAADMSDYDWAIEDEESDAVITGADREQYVKDEEGTLNPANGHFLCDSCYIKAGTPSSPEGWKMPITVTETNIGVAITEIQLPSVVAWEWSITEDATIYRHQIVWLRGTHSLRLGTQRGDGTWVTITIDNPERFGDLSSLDGARAAAHNFIFDREPGEGPRRMT